MKRTPLPKLPSWTPGLIDDMTLAPRRNIFAPSRPEINPADYFTRDELFRVAYVPFVIGELVWDYAHTCIDLAAQQRLKATKPLARAIHALRLEYDRARYTVISEGNRNHETYNAEVFEASIADLAEKFVFTLQCEINALYPDLTSDSRWMIVSTYQAIVLGKALQEYHKSQLRLVENRLTEHLHLIRIRIGSMLPSEFDKMLSLLPLFLGDIKVSERFPLKDHIKTIVNQIALIELNEHAEIEVS